MDALKADLQAYLKGGWYDSNRQEYATNQETRLLYTKINNVFASGDNSNRDVTYQRKRIEKFKEASKNGHRNYLSHVETPYRRRYEDKAKREAWAKELQEEGYEELDDPDKMAAQMKYINKIMQEYGLAHDEDVDELAEKMANAAIEPTVTEQRAEAMALPDLSHTFINTTGQYKGQSRPEYVEHQIGFGKHAHLGSKHYAAKVNPENVAEIRKLYWKDEVPMGDLAKWFEISAGSVHDIINRRTWVFDERTKERYPLVEGEPASQLTKMSKTEKKALQAAEKRGLNVDINRIGDLGVRIVEHAKNKGAGEQ